MDKDISMISIVSMTSLSGSWFFHPPFFGTNGPCDLQGLRLTTDQSIVVKVALGTLVSGFGFKTTETQDGTDGFCNGCLLNWTDSVCQSILLVHWCKCV